MTLSQIDSNFLQIWGNEIDFLQKRNQEVCFVFVNE